MAIPVSSIVNISVLAPGATLSNYNANTLAIVTKDAPLQNYGKGATATATLTSQAISAVTLGVGGTGYLTPPPVIVVGGGGSGALVTAQVSAGIVTGFTIISGGAGYTSVPTIVIGSSFQIYNNLAAVAADFGLTSETYLQAQEVFLQTPNITSGGGVLVIYAMNSADTILTAANALLNQVYVGAIIYAGYSETNANMLLAAAYCQAQSPPTMLGCPTNLLTDLYTPGLIYELQSSTLTSGRGVYYGVTTAEQARIFLAGYMSRGMATNFAAALTAETQNLKQIAGMVPDPTVNSTVLEQAAIVGADVYATIGASLPAVISSGGNGYFDNVFNLQWLVGALQVAYFNALAGTPTKVPQTDSGFSAVTNALLQVLEQAVTNGYLAPGAWNIAIPFGDPQTFLNAISAQGFYIYVPPFSTQTPAQRNARQAPVIQVAVKYAGAVQSGTALININY
jgi:hypothetical protein